MSIDLNNIPVEPTITIRNPDGSELITTNNPTTLQYIRLQIKQQKLEGYTILTRENRVIEIKPNGKLKDFPWTGNEVPGEVFDWLTFELIH
jgi:hypothetical protein